MDRTLDDQGPDEPAELLRSFRWTQRLAQRLVRDPGLAADLHQETWVRAVERFGDTIPARQWLAGTIRSMAFRARRGNQRRRHHEAQAASSDTDGGAEDVILRAEAQAEVAAAVRKLPKDLQIAVLLHFQEGLSMATIARRVGCSKSAAADRVQRGLLALRTELRAEGKGWRACVLLASPLGSLPSAAAGVLQASPGSASLSSPAIGALGATATAATLTGFAMKKLVLLGAIAALGLVAAVTWKLAQPTEDPSGPSEIAATAELMQLDEPDTQGTGAAALNRVIGVGVATRVAAPARDVQPSAFAFTARVVDAQGLTVERPRMAIKARDFRREAEGSIDGLVELGLSPADLEAIAGVDVRVVVSGGIYRTLHRVYIYANGTGPIAPPSAGRTEDLGTLTLQPAGAVQGQARSSTRVPIVGADVDLMAHDPEDPEARMAYSGAAPEVSSGEEGQFLMGHIAPGTVALQLMHPEFLVKAPTTTVTVTEGTTAGPVFLTASQAAIVTGSVSDRDGRTMEGVYVNGTGNWSVLDTDETDVNGRFRVGLRKGSPAMVRAYLPGWRQVSPPLESVRGAGEVHFVMEPVLPEAEFTVQVMDAKTEEHIYRLKAAVLKGGDEGDAANAAPKAIVQPLGGFSVDYVAGVDMLQISAEGYRTAVVSTADPREEIPHIVVKLVRAAGVHGRLLENGQPVAGARLRLMDLQERIAAPRETMRDGRAVRLETEWPKRLPGDPRGGFQMTEVLGLEGDPPVLRLVPLAARHGTETSDLGRFRFGTVQETSLGLVLMRDGKPARTIRRLTVEDGALDLGDIELQAAASVMGRLDYSFAWDPESIAVVLDDPPRQVPVGKDGSFYIDGLEPGPLYFSLSNAGLAGLPGGLLPFEEPPTFLINLSPAENRKLALSLDPWAPALLDLEVTIAGQPPTNNWRIEVTPIEQPDRVFRLASNVEGRHITATSSALGLCHLAIIRSSSAEGWMRMPCPGPPFDLVAGATVRRTINVPAGRLKITFGALHPCQRLASLDLRLEGLESPLEVIGLPLNPAGEEAGGPRSLRTAPLPAGTYRATLHPSKRLDGEDSDKVLAEFEVSIQPDETLELFLDR